MIVQAYDIIVLRERFKSIYTVTLFMIITSWREHSIISLAGDVVIDGYLVNPLKMHLQLAVF